MPLFEYLEPELPPLGHLEVELPFLGHLEPELPLLGHLEPQLLFPISTTTVAAPEYECNELNTDIELFYRAGAVKKSMGFASAAPAMANHIENSSPLFLLAWGGVVLLQRWVGSVFFLLLWFLAGGGGI